MLPKGLIITVVKVNLQGYFVWVTLGIFRFFRVLLVSLEICNYDNVAK